MSKYHKNDKFEMKVWTLQSRFYSYLTFYIIPPFIWITMLRLESIGQIHKSMNKTALGIILQSLNSTG